MSNEGKAFLARLLSWLVNDVIQRVIKKRIR